MTFLSIQHQFCILYIDKIPRGHTVKGKHCTVYIYIIHTIHKYKVATKTLLFYRTVAGSHSYHINVQCYLTTGLAQVPHSNSTF